ncbi:hypothetical protein STCU_02384 [Strigomonas culicis]|nr:hypothetical protein STCU_02384 [Strigomonas culicis]|eukprot:EPY33244.1 hypothetical protein STCU_02384 [Strigomonas culicis]
MAEVPAEKPVEKAAEAVKVEPKPVVEAPVKAVPESTVSNVDIPVDVSIKSNASHTATQEKVPLGSDDLLDEVLEEIDSKPTVLTTGIASASTTNSDGYEELKHLGVALKPPLGWEVREELSPVPNVAMVTVWNPDFANMPGADVPGAVPVIILSVEDIRGENLNLTEFKDRSKMLSLQQMAMMTGGAIQPVVRKDVAQQVGPFRHLLEYAQSMPPFFDISVINLLEVRNGVAYVFQIMCSPKVMNEFKSIFMKLATEAIINPMDTSALGYVEVLTGKVSVHIDSTWNWTIPEGAEEGPLAVFELPSTVKKEEIVLYETSKIPSSNSKIRSETVVDGVKIVSALDGAQERKLYTFGDFTYVVNPKQKAISFLPDVTMISSIKSVHYNTQPPKPKRGASFVSNEYGYRFDIVGGSRVVSTKLGNGTVVYALLGVPQDLNSPQPNPDEQGPTITVRIGNPENDPDCMSTLDEWHTRMRTEAAEGNVQNIERVQLKGCECLTFFAKEMQEVGPNQRVEVKGKVLIFVRNGVTTLIRWETTTGLWRKFERDMNAFLESFQFLN